MMYVGPGALASRCYVSPACFDVRNGVVFELEPPSLRVFASTSFRGSISTKLVNGWIETGKLE